MIKTILLKGDQDYLFKLFETYVTIKDKKELLKVCGKIIQKSNKIAKKEIISIFDTVYECINKDRKIIRYLSEKVQDTQSKPITNTAKQHQVKYLEEYMNRLALSLAEDLHKLIDDMKKAIEAAREDNVLRV
jgi:hypothetical protein